MPRLLTIFQDGRLSLTVWCLTMSQVTSQKGGERPGLAWLIW